VDASVELAEITETLRAALPDVLIAVDFDGTLAPLVPDPHKSRPAAGTIEALTRLAAAGARVAVITGRDAATAVRLGGLDRVPGILVAGLYGLQTWHDGTLDTPEPPDSIQALRERLPAVLAEHDADPDVWIEDKGLSLVVHGRKAADPDAALAPLREPVGTLADELGLELHPGRDVLELRIPGYDKAGVVRRFAEDRSGVLYLGDDLGDVPAFDQLRRMRAQGRHAYGVAVRSSGVAQAAAAADASVAEPADAVALLQQLGR
jgi:trehalose 6-phosphate phosphatase